MLVARRTLWIGTFALLGALGARAQTTWYVDGTAVPPGNGTALSPYTDVQYAIDQPTTVSGDTLLVEPGNYSVAVDTKSKRLAIVSTIGPGVTFLSGVGAGGKPTVIMTGGAGDCRLEGFTVLAQKSGVWIINEVTLRRCVIVASATSPASRGVRIEADGTQALLENCTIAGFAIAFDSNPFECPVTVIDSSLFLGNTTDLGSPGGCYSGTARSCAFQKPPTGNWVVTNPVVKADLGVWNPAQLDLHLEPLSVCIDAGNPALPPDPDGSLVDIGAMPYDPLFAPKPTTYCTGKIHSGGCAPRLSWSGTPTWSGLDDFVIASNLALNGMPGLFLWAHSPGKSPFAGGNLCLEPTLARGPGLFSGGSSSGPDCSGVFAWHVSHAAMQSQAWLPGYIFYAQAWGRDPGSSFIPQSQLSDAIVFQVLP